MLILPSISVTPLFHFGFDSAERCLPLFDQTCYCGYKPARFDPALLPLLDRRSVFFFWLFPSPPTSIGMLWHNLLEEVLADFRPEQFDFFHEPQATISRRTLSRADLLCAGAGSGLSSHVFSGISLFPLSPKPILLPPSRSRESESSSSRSFPIHMGTALSGLF